MKKNILIIMSDEQRWDTLGCTGNFASITPNLDALAETGFVFNNCFTPYPLCCPARASLWTGLMPHNHHVIGNWRSLRPDLAEQGLAKPFADAGYHTSYTGKWHVPGSNPQKFSFNEYSAIPAIIDGCDKGRYIEEYRSYAESQGYTLVPRMMENLTKSDMEQLKIPGKAPCGESEIKLEHYLETWQTAQFLQTMEKRPADKPFFAVCSYNAPHFPMIVPSPYNEIVPPESVVLPANFNSTLEGKPKEVLKSNFRIPEEELDESEWKKLIAHYLGFCALIDKQVGIIVEYLKEKDLLKDTIIVYTSDHGDMMGSHRLWKKGYPLHYEESLGVPLVISNPDFKGKKEVSQLVTLMDIVPTLAELSGVELKDKIDGKSFAGLIDSSKNNEAREYVIAETFKFNKAEGGRGEYIDPDKLKPDSDGMNISIRTETEKYIFRWNDIEEYFDLKNDPYEMNNLAYSPAVRANIPNLQEIIITEVIKDCPSLGRALQVRMEEKNQALK